MLYDLLHKLFYGTTITLLKTKNKKNKKENKTKKHINQHEFYFGPG